MRNQTSLAHWQTGLLFSKTVLVGILWVLAPSMSARPHQEDSAPVAEEGQKEVDDDAGGTAGEAEEKEPRTVNLIFQGEDPDRWNLDVGGGWNEDDGLYGRLALSTNNLLGRGEVLGVKLENGDRHELYELEYRKPYLFGRRQFLAVRVFADATERLVADANFDRERSGGAVGWGRRFGDHQSFEVEYSYADIEETDRIEIGGDATLIRQTSYSSSSIRPRWVFSTLDSRFKPFEGLRLTGAVDFAGGVLGGDTELVKPVFALTYFQPLARRSPVKSTLSVRTRLGWLEGDDGEVFSQQRFFLGGEESVRGFRRRSLGALRQEVERDDFGFPTGTQLVPARDEFGFPIGGDRMAQINLEAHLLLGGPFRLVFFADAATVLEEGQSFDSDLVRSSAGAELRIEIERLKLPLRLIWAENLDPLPNDRFEELSFSFGLSF